MSDDYDEDLAAIEATAAAYLTAFSRADLEAVLSTYAEDGVLMAPGRPASVGKTALAVAYPDTFATTGFEMAFEIVEVVQTSADWGFVRSTTEGTQTVKATGESHQAHYQELFILRRSRKRGWEIARYCTVKVD